MTAGLLRGTQLAEDRLADQLFDVGGEVLVAGDHGEQALTVRPVVEMGGKMRQIRASLEAGQWLAWLETAVPFTRRTITNYMRLSEWAEQDPREVGRLEHLGPTKLYMLSPLPPERRRELTTRGVPIVIPGHERPKMIDVMTVVELGRVIGGLTTRPSPKKPIGKVVQGLRHRIAGIDAVADELVRRKDEVDEEQAAVVLEALRAVLEELEGRSGKLVPRVPPPSPANRPLSAPPRSRPTALAKRPSPRCRASSHC